MKIKLDDVSPDEAKPVLDLPGGFTLYVKENGAGGRTYYSDDVPPHRIVLDTCLDEIGATAAALYAEEMLRREEYDRRNPR